MADPEKNGKDLKHVTIYKEDADETDRAFGENVSWAKRYRGMLRVIKRERIVDKVRRAILGVVEESGRITPETKPDAKDPTPPTEVR